MTSPVQAKKKILEAAESLLGYPDPKVKTTARVVADYLKGLPVGVDEFLRASVPDGCNITKVQFELWRFVTRGRVYDFREPVKVRVAREESYFLARSSRFLVHGTGETVEEALRDYVEEWHKHYLWLLSEADRLSPSLQKELVRIRRLLARERSAA